MAKYWNYINNGFYETPGENRYEITDAYWEELLIKQSQGYRIVTSGQKPIAIENIPTGEELLIILRKRREKECFSVINRGTIWYERLTTEQKQELILWYDEWLRVTETKIIPQKPEWL